MSSLRGRTRDSSWQWLVIGLVLGLGCSGVACLGSYALGVIRVNVPGSVVDLPTPTLGPTSTTMIVVVTATPGPTNTALPATSTASTSAATAPGAPTITPFVIAATAVPPAGSTSPAAASLPTLLGTNLVPATAAPASTSAATQAASFPSGGGVTIPAPGSSLPTNLTQTDLVTIDGGTFAMGTDNTELNQAVNDCVNRDKGKCVIADGQDSIPVHQVTLDSFQIEKYEVSFDQYLAFLNSLSTSYKTACGGEPCVSLNDTDKSSVLQLSGTTYKLTNDIFHNYAVTFVTWYGANAYCQAIGRRLPTEAEWERTARSAGPHQGTDKRLYPWGSNWDTSNANTNRPTPGKGFTQPIDAYPTGASADGIYGLAGNAAEWVSDWYAANYYGSTDSSHLLNPQGPASGQQKVVRGGAWDEVPFFARTVQRQFQNPGRAYTDIGFRCAANGPANGGSGTGSANGNPPASSAVTPSSNSTLAPS